MANSRLPKAKAEVSGAAAKNPQRYRTRGAPKGVRPLGEPYASMTPEQCEAWEELRAELPWLAGSHRAILRLACIMQVRVSAPDVGVNQIQTFSAILSKLGAAPADESKVNLVEDDEALEDRFFN